MLAEFLSEQGEWAQVMPGARACLFSLCERSFPLPLRLEPLHFEALFCLAGAVTLTRRDGAALTAGARQVLLLSAEEGEARMLGVPVRWMRRIVLLLATLVTGAIVSVTGLISFIGLIAPHIARLLTRSSRFSTTVLAGLCGGGLLLLADCLARSISASEVPVSIITSLLGAPFLFYLMCRKGDLHG